MKNILNYTVIILCFITAPSLAQQHTVQSPQFTLKAAPNQEIPDSIQVSFYKGMVGTGLGAFRQRIEVQKKLDGSFVFSFPTAQPISAFGLWIFYPREHGRQSNVYYAEPSDQIEIKVSKVVDTARRFYNGKPNTIRLDFSGKGAEKYIVNDRIQDIIIYIADLEVKRSRKEFGEKGKPTYKHKLESPEYYKSKEFEEYLNTCYANIKAGTERIQDTLSKYQYQLGKDVTDFFLCEKKSLDYYFTGTMERVYRYSKHEETKKALLDFYFSKIGSITHEPESKWWIYGPTYRKLRSIQQMTELNFKTAGNGFAFDVQYNAIKEVENTELREIMLTDFFVNDIYSRYVNNDESRDSCLNDALNFVKNPELNGILSFQLRFTKGSKMSDFSFSDTLGNHVGLKDLKGKAFVLDFYFLGCASCSAFAKRFEKEVYPEFANRPDFKILSVNINDKKENWTKAIRSGLYSQPNSIHLNTGGYNHPLFKKYSILTFPWVILVDKEGKVSSFKLQALSSPAIRLMIREALMKRMSK